MFQRVQAGRRSRFVLQAHPCSRVCWGRVIVSPSLPSPRAWSISAPARTELKAQHWQHVPAASLAPTICHLMAVVTTPLPSGPAPPEVFFPPTASVSASSSLRAGLGCSRAGAQRGSCHCGDGWVNFAVETRGQKSWLTALLGCECHRRHVHP